MKKSFKGLVCVCFLLSCTAGLSSPILVCSAEICYGNVAEIIGGKFVKVTNIISNPNADPHLFSITPETAIAITNAQVVIYNGADYDPWMVQLLTSQPSNNKLAVINVAELLDIKKEGNPHIWYNPQTFPTLAKFLTEKFSTIQPHNKSYFEDNLKSFNARYSAVLKLIDSIKSKYSGTSVIATEPVFGCMSDALGFSMVGEKFQWVIMNGSTPSPKMTTDFLNQIKNKKVKLLFYNSQVAGSVTKHILNVAKQNDVQILGISETMPTNSNVINWLTNQLKEVQKKLSVDTLELSTIN